MKLPSSPFSKAASAPPAQAPASMEEVAAMRKQLAETRLQNEIYHIVIDRYKKFIEDSEAKSIADLRALVRPLDSTVTEIKMVVQDQFHPFLYQEHFMQAVEKSLDAVFAWKSVQLPVSFWVSFSDMARMHAADDIDRAILLCSLLRSLGSESAKVLIGKNKSAWVSFKFNDKQYIIDIARRSMSAFPSTDDGLKQFMFSILYSFNDREYEDFSEG